VPSTGTPRANTTRETLNMAPQIIVIPQNLLQQNQAQSKSLLRISPQPKQFRVIASSPSQSLQSSRTIMSSPVTRPVATVVGCKRPAPPVSPEFDIKEIKEEEDEDEFTPVRKRANLDHLSPEERLMRRKLKNRVAAQNARDKKKAQCEEMEKMINKMKEEQQKLLEENSRLQEFNSKLQLDNASLQEENTELKQRLGINPVNPQLTVELPLSPLSTPPSSPPSLSSPRAVSPSTETASGWPQPSESSELSDPLQKDLGCRQAPLPSPGLSSRDLTPWERECLVTLWCVALLTSLPSLPPTTLPLKKRSRALTGWSCTSPMSALPPE